MFAKLVPREWVKGIWKGRQLQIKIKMSDYSLLVLCKMKGHQQEERWGEITMWAHRTKISKA